MPFTAIEVEEKNKKQLLDLYDDFMKKAKSKAQAFHSLDEFKNSTAYQDLLEEEQEHFKKHQGKKIIVLEFDDPEQALDFIKQAQAKGLIKKEQAVKAISEINEQMERPSYRNSM